MSDRVLYFRLHEASRLFRDWNFADLNHNGAAANQRAYARAHGAAGAWHADDHYRLFYMDGGKLRQKSWPHARPLREEELA